MNMWNIFVAYISSSIPLGIPLLYGSTGEIVTEKSGSRTTFGAALSAATAQTLKSEMSTAASSSTAIKSLHFFT